MKRKRKNNRHPSPLVGHTGDADVSVVGLNDLMTEVKAETNASELRILRRS